MLFRGFIIDGVVVEIFVVALTLEDQILGGSQASFDDGFGTLIILHIAVYCERGCCPGLYCKQTVGSVAKFKVPATRFLVFVDVVLLFTVLSSEAGAFAIAHCLAGLLDTASVIDARLTGQAEILHRAHLFFVF